VPFQPPRHKSSVWQPITGPLFTCPGVRRRSTRALLRLLRLHLSRPPDLFDLYLSIAVAAAASTLTEQRTPGIRHGRQDMIAMMSEH